MSTMKVTRDDQVFLEVDSAAENLSASCDARSRCDATTGDPSIPHCAGFSLSRKVCPAAPSLKFLKLFFDSLHWKNVNVAGEAVPKIVVTMDEPVPGGADPVLDLHLEQSRLMEYVFHWVGTGHGGVMGGEVHEMLVGEALRGKIVPRIGQATYPFRIR
jgi:hypothetical protein